MGRFIPASKEHSRTRAVDCQILEMKTKNKRTVHGDLRYRPISEAGSISDTQKTIEIIVFKRCIAADLCCTSIGLFFQ